MKAKTMDIILAGVGGQGSLLAGRVLGDVFAAEGYDVKISEVHGMAQRGGSVVTYVRAGGSVASPIVGEGCADIFIAFEELEALRYLPYLKKGGRIVFNTQKIAPMPVITGAAKYPAAIIDEIKNAGVDFAYADALALAREAGSIKCANVVMLGLAAASMDIPKERFIDAVGRLVPQKFVDVNLKAFESGYALAADA